MSTPPTYTPDPDFSLGDPVWYDPIPRPGGSGFAIRTAATFIRRTQARAVIRVRRHDGSHDRLVVDRARLRPRDPA